MKLLTLHKRAAYIQYKHTICSWPAIFVFLSIVLNILIPFYIAFYLFNDIWSQYKLIYEHPDIRFQYKYIFVAEYSAKSVEGDPSTLTTSTTCTSYSFLKQLFGDNSDCSLIKVCMVC